MELGPFCRDLVQQMRVSTNAGQTFNLDIQGDSDPVTLDERLLRHILNNLISNAIKYSSQGSTIDINISAGSGEIEMRVKDQDIGIEPAELESIFEQYFRGENAIGLAGTEIGLSIIKSAAEVHAGGSKFTAAPAKAPSSSSRFRSPARANPKQVESYSRRDTWVSIPFDLYLKDYSQSSKQLPSTSRSNWNAILWPANPNRHYGRYNQPQYAMKLTLARVDNILLH